MPSAKTIDFKATALGKCLLLYKVSSICRRLAEIPNGFNHVTLY